MAAPTTCTSGGCPDIATRGGRCETHRRASRGSSHQPRSSRPWKRATRQFLAEHPTCVDCGQPSEASDHDPYPRRVLVAADVTDPDDPRWLVARCHPCHNSRTASFERRLTPGEFDTLVALVRRRPPPAKNR